MSIIQNLKNLESFCGKKDAFDCAGINILLRRSLGAVNNIMKNNPKKV